MNYYRFNDDLLVAGIVVQDFPTPSPARLKALKRVTNRPTIAHVEAAREQFGTFSTEVEDDIRRQKNEIIQRYKESGAYKTEILNELTPHLKEQSAHIHDYRQFVSRVLQNLSVILERRFPGVALEDQLAKATHEELAIYWAAKLMEEKLRTFLFLLEPERLDNSKDVVFRFHGCVHKYLQIYQRSFAEKNVRVESVGTSYGELLADPTAIGVVPHTLIDNALKYSPRDSVVRVTFREGEDGLSLTVGSFGPLLEHGEERSIFDPFVRGKQAQRLQPDGSGVGLYLAQIVAMKYGTEIRVRQDRTRKQNELVWTEFSVQFANVRPKAGPR